MADEWNYETDITWAGGGVVYGESYPVFVNSTKFWQADSPVSGGAASPLNIKLVRVGLPLVAEGVDPGLMKLITGLWLVVTGTNGDQLSVRVGAQRDTPEDGVDWDGPFTYTIGSTDFIDPLISGRYAALEITSTAARPWKLVVYEVEFEVLGVH